MISMMIRRQQTVKFQLQTLSNHQSFSFRGSILNHLWEVRNILREKTKDRATELWVQGRRETGLGPLSQTYMQQNFLSFVENRLKIWFRNNPI